MTLHQNYIGIDVSKAHLDIFDPRTGQACRLSNQPQALARFAMSLLKGDIVIFEATGCYDLALQTALDTAGIGHVRVNPLRARDFARATGQIAKTDRLDAQMLAHMGQTFALKPLQTAHPSRRQLTALVRRRDQLVAIRAREANHRETADRVATDSIVRHVQWLSAEIAAIEKQIADMIETAKELKHANALLRSAPGIGPVAATTLLALLPELGSLSDKAIAALCGLAPINRDSGTWRGKRSIGQGRTRVRMALYMAALNATRCSDRFKSAYRAFRDRGKPAKLALIAIARKLIVTLNAMIRNNTPFKQQ
ncbi:MAG: transposase [Alphaproteobacteria bacterium]